MKVALIQHDIVWEDAAATHAHVAPLIADAAGQGAELIILTEMFATGFSMRPEVVAEDEGGPSENFLVEQSRRHGVSLIASLAQRRPNGEYVNNCILAMPDAPIVRYAKIHPFSYAGEHEKYTAGDEHVTVRVGDLRVSLFVCYDLRFADEFWTLARDTDLYVVPANWPQPRHEHWRALLKARAIENQAYVAGVNRVGAAPGLTHPVEHAGGSVLVDPMGVRLVEGGSEETILLAEVESRTVAEVRARWPFLSDRR